MTMTPALLGHFSLMQRQAARYIEPTPDYSYFASDSGTWFEGEVPTPEQRKDAFASDMIYMLDGPEQRAAQAEAEWDYIAETDLTASDVFGGDNSDAVMLSRALKNFIDASQELDKHKKVLFRKRSPSDAGLPPRGPKSLPTSLYFQGPDSELLHGIIGIATESGELAEVAWNRMVLGKPVDVVNVKEEIGDILWYVARLLRWAGSDFLSEMRRNIAKLRERHGTKGFDAQRDANRDLGVERAVLERVEAPVDRPRQPGDLQLATTGYAQVVHGEGKDTSFRGYDQPMIDHQPDPNTRDMFEIPATLRLSCCGNHPEDGHEPGCERGGDTFDVEEVAASNEMTGGQCCEGPKRGDPVEPPFGARPNTIKKSFVFPDDPDCRDA